MGPIHLSFYLCVCVWMDSRSLTDTHTHTRTCPPRLVLDEVDMLLDDSYYGDVRMIVQSMGGLKQVGRFG